MSSVDENRRRAQPDHPATFCFHKITNRVTFGSTNYSPKRLRQLFSFLQGEGFDLLPASAETKPGKSRRLLVTFDDGYAHLAESLPPLIEHFGVQPIIFMPTAWIGKANRWDYSNRLTSERHLSAAEIRDLKRLGVRFGSHGHKHEDLTSLSESGLRADLARSKAMLEDVLGSHVDLLSYPFGRVNERVVEVAANAGYAAGYTMGYPEPIDRPLLRGRYAIYFYDTRASVRRKLGGGIGRRLEKARADLTNRLSYGTILLNRIRRTDDE